MPHEQIKSQAYFDTPARAERLQLLLHLVRNVGEVIYLRAPAGAGKTRFVRKLLEILGSETASVWIRGGRDSDVAAVAADQLGLPAECAENWPDAVLEALGEQELLVVVDDADHLDLAAVERLAAMHARGGHLLLVGHGGLAQTNRDWDVQFVDLPAFDSAETTAFLRSRAGAAASQVTDDLAAALHQAAHGMPGPLLDALDELLSRASKRSPAKPRPAPVAGPRRTGWQWITGGTVVVLLAALLVFQDQINALFAPAGSPSERVAGQSAPEALPPPPGSTSRPPATDLPAAPASPVGRPPGYATEIVSVAREAGPADAGGDVEPMMPADTPSVDAAALAAVEPTEPAGLVTPPSEDNVPEPPPAAATDPLEAVMQDAMNAAQPAAADQKPTVPAAVAPDRVAVDEATPPAIAPEPAAPGEAAAPAAEGPAAEGPAVEAKAPAPATQVDAPRPAPVEERATPAPPRPRTPPPSQALAGASPADVAEPAALEGGMAWLRSRPAHHHTLQLVGARDRAGVEKFVRRHRLTQPYAIFERQLDGRPWYSLVVGDYPDRAAALAARDRLPRGVERAGVWPRTFESIFKSL